VQDNVQAFFVDPDLGWLPAAVQANQAWSTVDKAAFPPAADPVGIQQVIWYVLHEAVGAAFTSQIRGAQALTTQLRHP
jgi:hypothetical protein